MQVSILLKTHLIFDSSVKPATILTCSMALSPKVLTNSVNIWLKTAANSNSSIDCLRKSRIRATKYWYFQISHHFWISLKIIAPCESTNSVDSTVKLNWKIEIKLLESSLNLVLTFSSSCCLPVLEV
jgi:hypothetical protein